MSYRSAKFDGHSHSGSGVIRNLVCQVILQDHMVKRSYDFMDGSPSWYVTTLFGDHSHCGSGDMFLVAEEENSRYSRFNLPSLFNPPLLFISKGHGLKAHAISYY